MNEMMQIRIISNTDKIRATLFFTSDPLRISERGIFLYEHTRSDRKGGICNTAWDRGSAYSLHTYKPDISYTYTEFLCQDD